MYGTAARNIALERVHLLFRNEYSSVLSDQLTVEILKTFCVRGGLRTSNLRSIAWRIHLKCLPISKVEWVTVTNRARKLYAHLKQKNIPNPHDDRFCQDPQVNNPLDQTDHNPWQQYFADHDLRDLISKDVGRTFPELEFFQQDHIRRMMCDILLIYAKENSFVSYKQGMHEILAPLMFVLFSDQQSFCHCKETGGLKVQDATPTNHIMRDLVAIGERLHSVDPMLADHLNSLDIPPQLYGILPQCLTLLMFVILCFCFTLCFQVLQSDYGGCLQYLMRYPPIVDVSTFMQQALHFRNPKKYPRPSTMGALSNFSHMTVTGADHPNRGRQGLPMPAEMPHEDAATGLRNITSSVLSKVKHSVLEKPQVSAAMGATPPATPRKTVQNVVRQAAAPSWEKELHLMEEQVACLQIRLNEKDVVCQEAARNIELCVEQLRGEGLSIPVLCSKLLEISGNLTASSTNGVDNDAHEKRFATNRTPPQPRHIQRENEMVDLRMRPAK
ncbi:hypothetical protein ANCCEY_10771 [Ancylostoma ceylanicum]|uniref:Rab-GAP TBC domain-containing protein n=1 Tax=Ancylostoma ceylanicum TaxID=53326 RepID=A0A0D6LDF3_9BILA|nr:hypothetical protein ANCCEY_10771 [Ancylostoma ceylanicum]